MDNVCPICFEDLELKPTSKLINCIHEFHIECIHHWLKIRSNCPLCRTPLENYFNATQKFSKNYYLDCKLSLDPENKLNITYDNNYKVSIPYFKIKSMFIDKFHTNIEYNHFNKMIILKFKLPNAFYFLECFRKKLMFI